MKLKMFIWFVFVFLFALWLLSCLVLRKVFACLDKNMQ